MTIARPILLAAVGLAAMGIGAAVPAMQAATNGYLAPGAFAITDAIPPAPTKGDPRYEADRRIFRATRRLIATPRGTLARADVDDSPAAILRDYSCAVGIALSPERAPALLRLAKRALADTGNQNYAAKTFFKRQRPFHLDRGEICEARAELGDSFDYPSGHATRGWTWALVLAQLAPERAGAVMRRARAYGESRILCGAHNASAVEASALATGATMAVVRTTAAYQRDLETARAELATLRQHDTDAPAPICAAEGALIERSILAGLR